MKKLAIVVLFSLISAVYVSAEEVTEKVRLYKEAKAAIGVQGVACYDLKAKLGNIPQGQVDNVRSIAASLKARARANSKCISTSLDMVNKVLDYRIYLLNEKCSSEPYPAECVQLAETVVSVGEALMSRMDTFVSGAKTSHLLENLLPQREGK